MITYRAVFSGYDATGNLNLWVTDGTVAGTSELTAAGAYAGGLFHNPHVADPDFTRFGNVVLFAGEDASFEPDLWVTNGTSGGTSEIPVAGAYRSGLLPGNFTVFGKKLLFSGYDVNFGYNLWVTNGTSAGTQEVAVPGSAGLGLFALTSPDFTVLGDKVLFAGEDSTFKYGLWVTDGTSAGTHELTLAQAYSDGYFGAGQPRSGERFSIGAHHLSQAAKSVK
jgi:ELWxxDGT repeat protein